jgi:hypothetical protein
VNEKNFPIDDHLIEYSLWRTSAILSLLVQTGRKTPGSCRGLETFRNPRTLFNSWPATYPTTFGVLLGLAFSTDVVGVSSLLNQIFLLTRRKAAKAVSVREPTAVGIP